MIKGYTVAVALVMMAGCLIAGCITSCTSIAEKNAALMREAENIMWQMPDSALSLLGMVDTTRLDAGQQAGYILLNIQAKDKAGRSIAADTAIFRARDYFVSAKETEKAARAWFYAGRVYQERGSEQDALQTYLDALKVAGPLKGCDYLKGLIHFKIGDLYFEKERIDEAIARYRTSLGYFKLSQQETNEMLTWNAIGSSFLLKKDFDSALYYFARVSEIATHLEDTMMQTGVMQNIGIVYHYTGDKKKALQLFSKALKQSADEQLKARLYICLSQAYQSLQRNDSATFFIEQAVKLCEQDPKPPMAAIYKTIVDIEKSRKNYPKALQYAQKQIAYERRAHEKYEETKLAEYETKYNYMAEKEKNKNDRLIFFYILTGCLAVVVVSLSWVVWSRKLVVKKNRKISELNRDAEENRKEIALLKESIACEQETVRQLEIEKSTAGENTPRGVDIGVMIKEKEGNIGQLTEQIRQSYIHILKANLQLFNRYENFKIKLQKNEQQSLMAVDQHFYGETGQINWGVVRSLMPANIETAIKKEYDALNTNEVRLCCLLLFDVTYTDIALILQVTQKSAHTLANRIRNKLGIADIPETFKYLLHK